MIPFIFLGVVVLLSLIVLGVLFHMLGQEGLQKNEQKAVPVTNLDLLKNDLNMSSSEVNESVAPAGKDEIIPASAPEAPKDMILPALHNLPETPVTETQSSLGEETYKKRIQQLEEEIRVVKQKAEEQTDVTRDMILNLTKENQQLKNKQSDLTESPQDPSASQEEISKLKAENDSLQSQLEAANTKVRLLEEEAGQANAKLAETIQEKEALLAAPKPEPVADLRPELESARSESIQLKQKYEELEKTNQQLEYELVKARAQSSGLERVSTNYKNQYEELLKKDTEVKENNDQISQSKSSLEAMLEELKLKNEELVQKDQLSLFELEKNRARIVALERECEELKARVQQQNQQ